MVSGHCFAHTVAINQGPTKPTDAATKEYVDTATKNVGMREQDPLTEQGTEVGELVWTAAGIHVWDGATWKTALFV